MESPSERKRKLDAVANGTVLTEGNPRYFSNSEAAQVLCLSPRTLEKMRVVGGGPTFYKLGRRVVYALPDLQEWAARRRRSSTSDSRDQL